MKEFHLVISTPSGKKFDGMILRLNVKGSEGELGIMACHIPFATTVRNGKCRLLMPDQSVIEASTSEGLLTVAKNQTTLLVSEYSQL